MSRMGWAEECFGKSVTVDCSPSSLPPVVSSSSSFFFFFFNTTLSSVGHCNSSAPSLGTGDFPEESNLLVKGAWLLMSVAMFEEQNMDRSARHRDRTAQPLSRSLAEETGPSV